MISAKINIFGRVYNNYMKFVLKKQARWLVFLLLPFIFLLIIHVVAPLLLITIGNPVLQSSYNMAKKSQQFRTLYSFQQINQNIITERFNQYYQIFQTISAQLDRIPFSYLSIASNNLTLNNAFLFASSNQPDTYTQPISMWFAPNYTNYEDLNIIQKQAYNKYLWIQPYVRSLMPAVGTTSLIGLKTLLYYQNSSLAFEYPSQYEIEFSNLSNSGFPDQQKYLINKNFQKGQLITTFLGNESEKIQKLSICTALTNNKNQVIGVSCLVFDLSKLAFELYQILNFASSTYFSTAYYLLMSSTNDSSTYTRIIQINQTTGSIVSASTPSSALFGMYTADTSIDPKLDLRIISNGSSYGIYSPIIFQTANQTLFYFSSRNSYISTSLSNSTIFNTQINMTIGLISSLIILASIISIFLMKNLMNNLDEEMIQLSNYCTFIIDDDINIQIPGYSGTKDIKEVYQKVRTINKLNKYSHPNFFEGHHADKMLAYSQAKQFLHKIQYDLGAVLQNIGNSYFYMEQVGKTIQNYKLSVKSILDKIKEQYGSIDDILELKQMSRLPKQYREYEIILIRRLFNLIESYNCFLECQFANKDIQSKNKIIKEIFEYMEIMKKSVYPDFHLYAEFILVLFCQVKIHLRRGSFEQARKIQAKAEELSESYINNYAEIGKKMKEKGSKYKLLHLKNKITPHSRMQPDKMMTIRSYVKALVTLSDNKIESNYDALCLLFEGTKVGIFSNRVTWMIFRKIQRILQFFKINERKMLSLSIYKQICLLGSVKEKQVHSQQCHYRFPSEIPIQQQQYIFAVDCLYQSSSNYFKNRSSHIYDKFIQDADRVSIIKFNTSQGMKIECNLTLKQSKKQMLLKQIMLSFQQKNSAKIGYNELFQAFQKIIYRIMKLKRQKIVFFFLQKISKYEEHLLQMKKKQKSRLRKMGNFSSSDKCYVTLNIPKFDQFGDFISSILIDNQVQKCRICFFCDQSDKIEAVRNFFGLNQINNRLWRNEKGVNLNCNFVYVVESEHKTDIERILSKRVYSIPDNHVFIL